ncbi:MAG: ATP-dependent helicase [bacterium]|nr:MAG: ATP-dependent helicase [bacterium]
MNKAVDQLPEADLPEDWAAREQALDPERSFIVQAPAGSGKTGLLTQRFLQLLARVEAPEEIVAITFTRKAAGEMRNRILQALHKASVEHEPESAYQKKTWQLARAALINDLQHNWQLLLNPARLKIQTIDSFSQSLARQMPLLSQFGAIPSLTEDASDMYREAALAVLEQLETSHPLSEDIARLLRHRDNRMDELQGLIADMLDRRDQWMRHIVKHVTGDKDSIVRRQEIERVLQRLIDKALLGVDQTLPSEIKDTLPALAAFAAEHTNVEDSSIQNCVGMQTMPESISLNIDKWTAIADLLLTAGQWRKPGGVNIKLGFPTEKAADNPQQKQDFKEKKQAMQALLGDLQGNEDLRLKLATLRKLPAATYADDEWLLIESLFQLLVNAVGQLQLVFGQRGEVDFSEMTIRADRALGDEQAPTDLSLRLDYQIKHLLVDEFQDSSQNQYTLFSKLTAGWTPGDQRTLFLVGDPMQSIYRFREAEVGLFLQAWEGQLGSVQLEPLQLSVNFRSQSGIIDWVNQAFPQILPPESDKLRGAVHYTPSVPFKGLLQGEAVVVHPQFERDEPIETYHVLEVIEQCWKDDPEATIAILVRSKAHAVDIIHQLQIAGHKYQAVEIDKLSQRPVVQDLLSLTRALIHPADRISWLAILRAPWCGLTLADLHALAAMDSESAIIDLLRDERCREQISDDGQQRLRRIMPVLEKVLAQRGRHFLRGWVEGAWMSLGGPACLHSQSDREDAEVYLGLLQEIDDGGEPVTPELLHDKMSSLFARPDVEADERLQIMSMHKSKGLEFDTVILPGLGKRTGQDQSRLLYWLERTGETGKPELMFGPIASVRDGKNQTVEYIKHLDKEKSQFENGRLLYVAATRARKHLHLLGYADIDSKNDELKTPSESTLLFQFWPVVKDDYENQFALFSEEEIESLTQDTTETDVVTQQTRKRLVTDWVCPSPPVSVLALAQQTIETEEIVEFDWASESARLVGTVVHRQLEYLSRRGIHSSADLDLARLSAISRQMLRHEGLPLELLDQALKRVNASLQGMLEDERGCWILSTEHKDVQSEYAISCVFDGKVYNMVIDRTFIDEQGTRWIIDYKTGSHSGSGLDEFLDREQDRYRPQLERYAEAISRQEERSVRLALYFPLMQGWREWGYDSVES